MKRSKKIFLLVAALFFVAVLAVTYDISRKTTFPGSKKYLEESIAPTEGENEKDEESSQPDSTSSVTVDKEEN